eukprot:2416191-Prymnesium_polylepis.1
MSRPPEECLGCSARGKGRGSGSRLETWARTPTRWAEAEGSRGAAVEKREQRDDASSSETERDDDSEAPAT